MQNNFTPETLVSRLYHSNNEIPESLLDAVFSNENLINAFVEEANRLYPNLNVSDKTICNINQFASSFVLSAFPDTANTVFMS